MRVRESTDIRDTVPATLLPSRRDVLRVAGLLFVAPAIGNVLESPAEAVETSDARQILAMLINSVSGANAIRVTPNGVQCEFCSRDIEITLGADGMCSQMRLDRRTDIHFSEPLHPFQIGTLMMNAHRAFVQCEAELGGALPEEVSAEGGARFTFERDGMRHVAIGDEVFSIDPEAPVEEYRDPDGMQGVVRQGTASVDAYAREVWTHVDRDVRAEDPDSRRRSGLNGDWRIWLDRHGKLLNQSRNEGSFANLHERYLHTMLLGRSFGVYSEPYASSRREYIQVAHRDRRLQRVRSDAECVERSNLDDPSHFVLTFPQSEGATMCDEWLGNHLAERTWLRADGSPSEKVQYAYYNSGELVQESRLLPNEGAGFRLRSSMAFRKNGSAQSVYREADDVLLAYGEPDDGPIYRETHHERNSASRRLSMLDGNGSEMFHQYVTGEWASRAEYLQHVARSLRPGGKLDRHRLVAFIENFFEYANEKGDVMPDGFDPLNFMRDGRIVGDCDNYAALLCTILRYMGENAHVVAFETNPGTGDRHATCIVLKKLRDGWHSHTFCNFTYAHNGEPYGSVPDPARMAGRATPREALAASFQRFILLHEILRGRWPDSDSFLSNAEMLDYVSVQRGRSARRREFVRHPLDIAALARDAPLLRQDTL